MKDIRRSNEGIMRNWLLIIYLLVIVSKSFGQKLPKNTRDSIKVELAQILEDDQRYRWQLMLGELDSTKLDSLKSLPDEIRWQRINRAISYKVGFGKVVADSLWQLQNNLDSLNKEKFIEIVKLHGYPSYKRTKAVGAGTILIHMVDSADFYKLLPLLSLELKKGNMPAYEYASWYDRCQLNLKRKQLYGAYDSQYPCVENLEDTNNERKKIGLKRLKVNNCRE